MGQKDKLVRRLRALPRDFTYDEAETLLRYFGYRRSDKGRTSGSRVMFISDEHGALMLHRPHPQKELKVYQVRMLLQLLEQEGLI